MQGNTKAIPTISQLYSRQTGKPSTGAIAGTRALHLCSLPPERGNDRYFPGNPIPNNTRAGNRLAPSRLVHFAVGGGFPRRDDLSSDEVWQLSLQI